MTVEEWDRIKDDPKRLLLGVDPASTELWNGILGKDDEPIVNFLGGPMGSGWTGMGSGGVYDRAEAADQCGLNYDHTFRCITLNVHSSLEAVGLTAAVSTALSDNQISANIIAGFYHDHIFVQSESAKHALGILSELSQ